MNSPFLVRSLALLSLILPNVCLADIIITENSATGIVRVQGGGGASPVVVGPITQAASNTAGVVLDNSQSIHGIATDALMQYRGEATGDGTAAATTLIGGTWEISATGGTSAAFTALPDLGIGGASADLRVLIGFTVTSSVNYTFNGSLSGDVGGADSIKLQRLNPPNVPISTEFVFAGNTPLIGETGTLIAADYQIVVDLFSSSAGGEIQSPGMKGIDFAVSLDLSPDPTVTPVIVTDFEELTIREFARDEDDNPFLTFDSALGVEYRVKTSTDLLDPWDLIPGSSIIGSGARSTIGVPLSPDSSRYYKIVRITPY